MPASLAKHLLTGRTSERNHREENKRSKRLLDCSNPPDTAHNLRQGGGKVTEGRLRPVSCAKRKMILISEYQSKAANKQALLSPLIAFTIC